jgi:transcription antitermination protein NusB
MSNAPVHNPTVPATPLVTAPVAPQPGNSPHPRPALRTSASKNARSRAREFAVQALYQHLVGHNTPDDIDAFTCDLLGFSKADAVHFDALLHGCIANAQALDNWLLPLLDRPWAEISPVEHSVMWIGAYEFAHCPDVPWRVVLNECIELSKSFGGTDGHKYVNGVLMGLAPRLRSAEVQADPQARLRRPIATNLIAVTPDSARATALLDPVSDSAVAASAAPTTGA